MTSRQRLVAAHDTAFWLAHDHAERCHECYHPIMDEEGNPGYLGEACKQGAEILKAYMAAESALVRKERRRL